MSVNYLYNKDICSLTSEEAEVIVFQYNCTSKKPRGKEIDLFNKFPYADIYSSRKKESTPGTIKMLWCERLILAFFTRKRPGKPIGIETNEKREEWFKKCLEKTSQLKNLSSIAFPCDIEGNWENYEKMIKEFKTLCPKTDVIIVSKEPNPNDSEPTFEFLKWVWKQLQESNLINEKYFQDKYKKEKTPDISNQLVESSKPLETPTYENTSLEEFLSKRKPPHWEKLFTNLMEEQYMKSISNFLERKAKTETIYPPLKNIFAAFEICNPKNMKVVILGQDPYHNYGAAMGLSFSTPKGNKLQPSLRNIFKELQNDGFKPNFDCGDLTYWAKQGVFLINTALTVKEGSPNSHRAIWEDFMDQLFRYINNECEHLVAIFWGNNAKKYTGYFSDKKHVKILGGHPSPLNSKGDFSGTKPFSRTNKYLEKWGYKPIDWNLN